MYSIEYVVGSAELLDFVGPLWERLNEHHWNNSIDFKPKYANMKYESRKEALLKKSCNGKLRIELAREIGQNNYVGYCISSIDKEGNGEIESIYVDPHCRGSHIGDSFMKSTLEWMDLNGVISKSIGVAAGNEQAFGFYRRYGFCPSVTILRKQ